jgi:hypothetical protein
MINTDASNHSTGTVLLQEIGGKERVIAYARHTLTKQRNDIVWPEKIPWLSCILQKYLYGRQFRLRTYHRSLKWLVKLKNPEGKLARGLEVIIDQHLRYIKIEHHPGKRHGNTDAHCRIQCTLSGLDPSWEEQPKWMKRSLIEIMQIY